MMLCSNEEIIVCREKHNVNNYDVLKLSSSSSKYCYNRSENCEEMNGGLGKFRYSELTT